MPMLCSVHRDRSRVREQQPQPQQRRRKGPDLGSWLVLLPSGSSSIHASRAHHGENEW
ncbi:hypothetical protein TSAR_003211 [Trichomalopsis sarcophagae]|uniref:Uncharacterized protein n=1 Tax=Trichomalopsis sarcophagae TaxID=543379 RepID=A0A232F5N6_9HYME|nr:hypothetical protein TSAR_003211 [Trichomalopsis sarcophagae]